MSDTAGLGATSLLAQASQLMEDGGYRRVQEARVAWPFSNTRIYEDGYGVVAVVVFETWAELKSSWTQAQAALVELISKHVGRGEAKAWEGYLVLLTPGVLPAADRPIADDIRYDTTRVRKLLGTGEELRQLSDVERTLLPVLPLLATGDLRAARSSLDVLPDLLARRGISADAVREIVRAFEAQVNLMERLDRYRGAR